MKGRRFAFLGLAILLFASGCGQKPGAFADKDAVVTINSYSVSRDEFESEFRASTYGDSDTPESRDNFLNALIDRKLILQYAQAQGLDKEKVFLKSIEKFWEQSLLKVALDRKTREIDSRINTTDWAARRVEEAKSMSDWMSELRKNATITLQRSVPANLAAQERSR